MAAGDGSSISVSATHTGDSDWVLGSRLASGKCRSRWKIFMCLSNINNICSSKRQCYCMQRLFVAYQGPLKSITSKNQELQDWLDVATQRVVQDLVALVASESVLKL